MHSLLNIKIIYQGQILTERYFNEHPEIHSLYPSKTKFMEEVYLPLLKTAQETGQKQDIEISENGMLINGVFIAG
jgi:hypothetical protein